MRTKANGIFGVAAFAAIFSLAPIPVSAVGPSDSGSVTGKYLEVRSCDVYTGPCFANGQMGLTGKEGILVWSVDRGSWNNVDLDGLQVMAVVCTDATLGDQQYQPRQGTAVLIVDQAASPAQQSALADFARTMAGDLTAQVVQVISSPMAVRIGGCADSGCAEVKAGDLVEISTRCIGGKDHLCGNEETYYPPLTEVQQAVPAVAEVAAYRGSGLNRTWELLGQRSAFLANFDTGADAQPQQLAMHH